MLAKWNQRNSVGGLQPGAFSHFDRVFIKTIAFNRFKVKIKMHLSVRSFLDISQ